MKIITEFNESGLGALADFALVVNAEPGRSSMFCSNRRENVLAELRESGAAGRLAACTEDGVTLAAAWLYYDEERKNGDVNLLVSQRGEPRYEKIADALLTVLRRSLPPEAELTFYFPIQNKPCGDYLNQRMAKRNVNEYCLILGREDAAGEENPRSTALEPQDYQQFLALHDETFPNAYLSGHGVLESLGKDRSVYVEKEGDKLLAYGVLQRKSTRLACVEMLCVRNDSRHGGLGRRMLLHLIAVAFGDKETEFVNLIVDSDNVNALRLYLSCGFRVQFENLCYTMKNCGKA